MNRKLLEAIDSKQLEVELVKWEEEVPGTSIAETELDEMWSSEETRAETLEKSIFLILSVSFIYQGWRSPSVGCF